MFSRENLERIANKDNTELCTIMAYHYSDKAYGPYSKHHNYTKLYDELFSSRRDESLNVLEIGIGSTKPNILSNMRGTKNYKNGASIRGWAEYFPNANIYACDIDTDILEFNHPRITGFYMDQTDTSHLEYLCNDGILKDIQFDYIIDDGLHYFPVNCSVMNYLLPKVKSGGYYIIEDIIHEQFDYKCIDFNKLNGKEYQYVRLPNPHNNSDNNLFIVNC